MHVIVVRNVNHALPLGFDYLLNNGAREESRVGPVLVAPGPVTTVYVRPTERVLFSAVRDANPFFHLAESIWMLLGRADAGFLDHFVRDFGSRFAEEDGLIHGAYGRRWRNHFMDIAAAEASNLEVGQMYPAMDQVAMIISELRDNPGSRQAVLAMWDPEVDLGAVVRDKPCNTHVYFRVRGERGNIDHGNGNVGDFDNRVLDMTVCCRSNDIIMGAYGANAVHFSLLQEYVASMVGVGVGTYRQVSNNYHMYVRDVEAVTQRAQRAGRIPPSHQATRPVEVHGAGLHHLGPDACLQDGGVLWDGEEYRRERSYPTPLILHGDVFLREAAAVVQVFEDHMSGRLNLTMAQDQVRRQQVTNPFLDAVLWHVLLSAALWRRGHWAAAMGEAELIASPDWRMACTGWIQRRLDRRSELGEKK